MGVAAPFFGLAGILSSVLSKPKAPKVVAQPIATPRANSVVADTLAARRGSAENMRTGATGAESSTGKKTLLGQ